jgi:hypothetical protein
MLVELRYLSTHGNDWRALQCIGSRLASEVARQAAGITASEDSMAAALLDAQACAGKCLSWADGFESDAEDMPIEYIDLALRSVRAYSQ